jgi:hypothetical protein
MYGVTRATTTLLGAGLAGLLVWLASQMDTDDLGEYWAFVGFLAAAGLTMALSQLLGGWTKWGWPRVSAHVFLLGFVPVLIVALWVILAAQPESGWLQGEAEDWAGDIGLDGLLDDLRSLMPVLAFGTGLVFGFTFDTTGPRTEPVLERRRREAVETPEEAPPPEPERTERGA